MFDLFLFHLSTQRVCKLILMASLQIKNEKIITFIKKRERSNDKFENNDKQKTFFYFWQQVLRCTIIIIIMIHLIYSNLLAAATENSECHSYQVQLYVYQYSYQVQYSCKRSVTPRNVSRLFCTESTYTMKYRPLISTEALRNLAVQKEIFLCC